MDEEIEVRGRVVWGEREGGLAKFKETRGDEQNESKSSSKTEIKNKKGNLTKRHQQQQLGKKGR